MLTTTDLSIGQLVKSKAGRDKDRLFIIIGIIDDQYVTIVDGDLRRVEAPKRKKIRHLSKINRVSETVQQLLPDGELTNPLVRREIEKLGSNTPSQLGGVSVNG